MMKVWHFFAGLARALLPMSFIKWLRGDYKSVHGRLHNKWEGFKLWLYRLKGGSYIDWYAKRMDGFAAEAAVDPAIKRTYHDSGSQDLETLRQLGLEPSHRLHEFGCGFLRSAHYFVSYLEPGKFSGNDASGERIKNGLDYVKKTYGFDMKSKAPNLIANKDNSWDWLPDKPDMIWCYAVFTHMPEDDIEDVVRNLHKVLKPTTGFYFTYSEKTDQRRPVERMGAQDWWHKQSYFDELAARHGLKIEHDIPHLDAQRQGQADHYVTRFSRLSLA